MNNAKNNNESATATKRAITVNGKVKKLKRTQPAKKIEGADEFLWAEKPSRGAEGQSERVSFSLRSTKSFPSGAMSDDGRHCAGRHIRMWRD